MVCSIDGMNVMSTLSEICGAQVNIFLSFAGKQILKCFVII